MSSRIVSGRVLVVIRDHLSEYPHLTIFVQSARGVCHAADVLQDHVVGFIRANGVNLLLSKQQQRAPSGTTFRITIRCSIEYHRSYDGDWDAELYVNHQRTLRTQHPTRKSKKQQRLLEKQLNRAQPTCQQYTPWTFVI